MKKEYNKMKEEKELEKVMITTMIKEEKERMEEENRIQEEEYNRMKEEYDRIKEKEGKELE